MKRFILPLLSLLLIPPIWAKSIDLPMGGKMQLDISEWDVLETKKMTGKNSILLVHKKQKELQGVIMDGTIKLEGHCKATSKAGEWELCQATESFENKIGRQVFLQRSLGEAFQRYIIIFNYPKDMNKDYSPILDRMIKFLEAR